MIDVRNPGLEYYVMLLRENHPFSFLRYGNGEWGCILGTAKITGTGSQRLDIKQLKNGLIGAIGRYERRNDYFLAMQSRTYLARVKLLPLIENWLKTHASQVVWHEGEIFAKCSMRGTLAPLVRQLREMPVVVVGPKYLRALDRSVFGYTRFIEIKPQNCFDDFRRIRNQILRSASGCVVSFSAGPTTKALIGELHGVLNSSFLLDFGSLWDPYCGRKTRKYHERLTTGIREKNLR